MKHAAYGKWVKTCTKNIVITGAFICIFVYVCMKCIVYWKVGVIQKSIHVVTTWENTDILYLRCLRKRSYQMDVMKDHWKCILVNIIRTHKFGYAILIVEIRGNVLPQCDHEIIMV
jgi:hypothetical protein